MTSVHKSSFRSTEELAHQNSLINTSTESASAIRSFITIDLIRTEEVTEKPGL